MPAFAVGIWPGVPRECDGEAELGGEEPFLGSHSKAKDPNKCTGILRINGIPLFILPIQ